MVKSRVGAMIRTVAYLIAGGLLVTGCLSRDAAGAKIGRYELVIDGETAAVLSGQRYDSRRPVRANTLVALLMTEGASEASARALATAMLLAADEHCDAYFANLTLTDTVLTGSLSTGQVVASGVGSFAEANANAWSGVSTIFGGTRDALRRDLLSEQSMPIILQAVSTARNEIRADITAELEESDIDLPTTAARISDYHRECGVSAGLSRLSAALAEDTEE